MAKVPKRVESKLRSTFTHIDLDGGKETNLIKEFSGVRNLKRRCDRDFKDLKRRMQFFKNLIKRKNPSCETVSQMFELAKKLREASKRAKGAQIRLNNFWKTIKDLDKREAKRVKTGEKKTSKKSGRK